MNSYATFCQHSPDKAIRTGNRKYLCGICNITFMCDHSQFSYHMKFAYTPEGFGFDPPKKCCYCNFRQARGF